MCLNYTIKTKILKNDLEVFKVIKYNIKNRHYYISIFNYHQQRIKKGTNKAKYTKKLIIYGNHTYTSGYHCFLNVDSAITYLYSFGYLNKHNFCLKVRKFIIPKGTKVTLGVQTVYLNNKNHYLQSIITPILLNKGNI